jgi:hypothetical protein
MVILTQPNVSHILSLYQGVFNVLKITTTTHNVIVCISFNSKSAHRDPPIFIYMQKEDSLSFPLVLGSGGPDWVFLTKYASAQNGWDRDFYGVLMWFEFYVWCGMKSMFATIPMYFSMIAKTIWWCDKLWFFESFYCDRNSPSLSNILWELMVHSTNVLMFGLGTNNWK